MTYKINPADVLVATFSVCRGGFSLHADPRVRLTHVPTGIKVEEGSMRSQNVNKAVAWEKLQALLDAHFAAEKQDSTAPLPEVPPDVLALLDDVIDHAWNDGASGARRFFSDATQAARQRLLERLSKPTP